MEVLFNFHELVLELIQTRKQIKHQKLQQLWVLIFKQVLATLMKLILGFLAMLVPKILKLVLMTITRKVCHHTIKFSYTYYFSSYIKNEDTCSHRFHSPKRNDLRKQ